MMVNKADNGISFLSYSFHLNDEVVHLSTNCLAIYIRRTIDASWQSGSKLVLVAGGHSRNALVVYNQNCSSFLLGAVLVNVICEGYDSDGEIVVEDSATSSLVSSSFIGCEVNLGGEKAIADLSASSLFVHTSMPAPGACISPQTI